MSGEAKVGLKASDRGSYYNQEALLSDETDKVMNLAWHESH